jgi:hypothetical protein
MAIASRIADDPSIVRRARERVERWLKDEGVARHYAYGWQQRLNGSTEALLAFLVDTSETARAFRQVSPFAGVLTPRERWALWAAKNDDDTTAT